MKPVQPPAGFADDCIKVRRAVAAIKVPKISRNSDSLTGDETAIYRIVLQQQSDEGVLNVSSRTFPLDTIDDVSSCECIEGMEPDALVRVAHSYHQLTPELLRNLDARLVNGKEQATLVRANDPGNPENKAESLDEAHENAFATGLFSLSEIVFDANHTRALVSFSFVCGSLCGRGSTNLFEKIDGKWRQTNRVCGGWLS